MRSRKKISSKNWESLRTRNDRIIEPVNHSESGIVHEIKIWAIKYPKHLLVYSICFAFGPKMKVFHFQRHPHSSIAHFIMSYYLVNSISWMNALSISNHKCKWFKLRKLTEAVWRRFVVIWESLWVTDVERDSDELRYLLLLDKNCIEGTSVDCFVERRDWFAELCSLKIGADGTRRRHWSTENSIVNRG